MKIFFGLHKTVDDKWTSAGMYVEEPAGVVCRFDDGSSVIVVSDGRVMRFAEDGTVAPQEASVSGK